MSAVWNAVKKTLNCKSETSEVYEPKPTNSRLRKTSRSRNSWCKPSLKDVKDHHDDHHAMSRKRFSEKRSANFSSPLSIRSSDLINPFTNLVRISNQSSSVGGGGGSPYVATLSPGSRVTQYFNGGLESLPRSADVSFSNWTPGSSSSSRRISVAESRRGGSFRTFTCHKCDEPLSRVDVEAHLLSKHAVSEVQEGDSSRKIIEMIFRSGWTSFENRARIERILKVHNPQTKLAQFEEYREMVKIRANRLQHSKKHPRCLADGNELLRFYGTTLACQLGRNGSSSLCASQSCNVCCILRHGFSSIRGLEDHNEFGIFTTSTSERAYRSIEIQGEERGNPSNKVALRKALIVCRVIAGRVHKPMVVEDLSELAGGRRSGFDSLAGKMGHSSLHIEELYLLNPTALLPCFVIVCK